MFKVVWNSKTPPKVQSFTYKLLWNMMSTRDNLYRRKWHVLLSTSVKFCRSCPTASNIWQTYYKWVHYSISLSCD